MSRVATTKLSSRGQVVIPEEIRKRLGLAAGHQFVVIGEGDVVILKLIGAPALDELAELLRRARSQARAAGLKRSDIKRAVTRARKRR
jgi:AbrB family looped-hinge helix DNA binding protein